MQGILWRAWALFSSHQSGCSPLKIQVQIYASQISPHSSFLFIIYKDFGFFEPYAESKVVISFRVG